MTARPASATGAISVAASDPTEHSRARIRLRTGEAINGDVADGSALPAAPCSPWWSSRDGAGNVITRLRPGG